MDDKYLDAEEKEIMEAFTSVKVTDHHIPNNEEQMKFKHAATEFIKKEKNMNIRIDPVELEKIKEQATREGLKYQTFVKSVLHKYITGQLVERQQRI